MNMHLHTESINEQLEYATEMARYEGYMKALSDVHRQCGDDPCVAGVIATLADCANADAAGYVGG